MKLVTDKGITDLSKCVQILRDDDFSIIGVLETGRCIRIASSPDIDVIDAVWKGIRHRYLGSIEGDKAFVLTD